MMKSDSIVFFGSGEISLSALKQLSGLYSIEAIITKPDRLIHRSLKQSPVKNWAKHNNLPIFQPGAAKELADLIASQNFKSQLGFVADYGLIIPKSVIDYFPDGIINSHFSLLPHWRGADPIRAAILNGDKVTGVTLIIIDEGLDTGDVIAQEKLGITTSDTAPTLVSKLTSLNGRLINSSIPLYISGEIKPSPQDRTITPTFAPKIAKTVGQIDWSLSAVQIERQIRAYLGWPGSKTTLQGTQVTVLEANVVKVAASPQTIGSIIPSSKQLLVQTGDNSLEIVKLKPAGKREMNAVQFINGYLR